MSTPSKPKFQTAHPLSVAQTVPVSTDPKTIQHHPDLPHQHPTQLTKAGQAGSDSAKGKNSILGIEHLCSRIPLSEPALRGNEWIYVKQCLDDNWISTAGQFVERFEQEVAGYLGCDRAVATSSGTSALHTALLAAGVAENEEVLVPTVTFIATANAVRHARACPVFLDVEANNWQLDPNLVEDFLRTRCQWKQGQLVHRQTGRRVRAILPVHILGHPVEIDPLLELANRFDLLVIEDNAEALGAEYRGRKTGALGHVGCLSFNGNKTITTGGGGMITTNDPLIAERAHYLSTQARDDAGEYIHGEVGYNYRLPNILAAIGCAQLEQLPSYLAAKRSHAVAYQQALTHLPGIRSLEENPWCKATYWLSAIQVDADRFGLSSRQLRTHLAQADIESRPLWQPMHLSPAHRGAPAILRGVADRLYQECLCLPSSVGLQAAQRERVIQAVIAAPEATRRSGSHGVSAFKP